MPATFDVLCGCKGVREQTTDRDSGTVAERAMEGRERQRGKG